MAIRVLLADDHGILRAGLRALIEREPGIEVVAEAEDGRRAVEMAAGARPDVVILDIGMPLLNGVDAARQIAEVHPEAAIVMLSMHADEAYVLRSLRAGARAYLLKDSAETELLDAIRTVRGGRRFFSPRIQKMLHDDHVLALRRQGVEDRFDLLSAREREILQLIGEGRPNKEIANLLHLSPYTVETHRSHILQKLDLHSVAELVLYAVRKGLVSV